MKTLSILFSEPNVLYAVIDGVNVRIDNPELLPIIKSKIGHCCLFIPTDKVLKSGDIFQVEGFEYEVKTRYVEPPDTIHCNRGWDEKVAILKLAKEEEPKEKLYTIDEVIHKLRLGLTNYGKKNGIAGYWVLEDNVYYILNKLKK
jgi:hypothetical protein